MNPRIYHFCLRLQERYGITPNDGIIDSIMEQIHTRSASLLRREKRSTGEVLHLLVRVLGRPVWIIFSQRHEILITAVPMPILCVGQPLYKVYELLTDPSHSHLLYFDRKSKTFQD